MQDVTIIGAGIAGLSAGVYLQKCGFDVTIYEHHTIPGGASTSWKRGGYFFEGGMHWLTGSSPKTSLNKCWREVGALDDAVSVRYRDPFFTYMLPEGEVRLWRDPEKLCEHLTALSPDDAAEVRRLCKDIKAFQNIQMPVSDVKGLKSEKRSAPPLGLLLGMLPLLGRMKFYATRSCAEYASQFKSPLLRAVLENTVGKESAAIAFIFTVAGLSAGDGGYPEGGSLAMAQRIADTFVGLGGTVAYKSRVEQVTVHNGRATGVVVDGAPIATDAVVVTQDVVTAAASLFTEPLSDTWITDLVSAKTVTNTFVGLGVEADCSDWDESVFFEPQSPVMVGGVAEPLLLINNYAGFAGYAPSGCTALTCLTGGSADTYDWWKAARENGTYQAEKEKLAKAVMHEIEAKLPQTKGRFKIWDVATPLTYERYLYSYKGSWMSVMEAGTKQESLPVKPSGIENVYFAGWRMASPGGLPVALSSGRTAAQTICKDAQRVWRLS
ncbi:MAG: NAD(P)/FAD-dependent oxidoreductase [Coriobacteriales bacterium]|nr:NAD(P)/FAD-dependent oxidoreductase [Coriobacteriales bacterium]